MYQRVSSTPGGILASGNKFGTFGGVFTPSILTILGVIMYLRLPWIVGNAGLYLAIGIILAAHLISVTTGLSVSSIATDKRVEAGGAYYIVSRSMGLAMGGTLGVALFVGLSFSISLYIIGFSESFLDYYEYPTDIATIRICGSIVLVLLTVITFISTSLAIRTQFFILLLIGASLVSIFAGSTPDAPATAHLLPFESGESATVLFGIFFPAVTGFTAGVNMSGDLSDPRRAIPVGTMISIAVGLVVYVGLAIFLAVKIEPTELIENGSILLDIAWSPRAVVGGIWGATISSALGSILGAPRILQALSLDHITPKIFGIGQGPSNEPRYALLLACLIGEAGILIGELDAIARIVSVFFIATYGFLNLSASFEMIASPDFRPDFKIPRLVPVVGAVTCAVLMIWLDLVAMLGAVVAMSLLFVILKRKELQLETGDAWLGVWSSVVRQGLQRLTTESLHQRNWRPNIVLFTHQDAATRKPLLEFGHSLIRHRGVLTEWQLQFDVDTEVPYQAVQSDMKEDEEDEEAAAPGYFSQTVRVDEHDVYETMSSVSRFHGFSGLEPNTVMLDWHEHASRPDEFCRFLDVLEGLDYNTMCLSHVGEAFSFPVPQRIDLWWSATAGSLPLNIALVRYVTSSDEWRRANMRFYVLNDDASLNDSLHKSTVQALQDARIEGTVKVVNNAVEMRPHEDWIAQFSADADLTVVGLPHERLTPSVIERYRALSEEIGAALMVRASSQFASGFAATTVSTVPRDLAADVRSQKLSLPPLQLPETGAIAALAVAFADAHMTLSEDFAERCIRAPFASYGALVDELIKDVQTQYRELEAVMDGAGVRRRRRTFARAPKSLLQKARQTLDAFERQELARQQASVDRGIEQLLLRCDALEDDTATRVVIARDYDDFIVSGDDPSHLRRFKDHRRYIAFWTRRPLAYSLHPRPLARFYLQRETVELAHESLALAAGRSLIFAEETGRYFNALKDSLGLIGRRFRSRELDSEFIAAERARLLEHLHNLQRSHVEAGERQAAKTLLAARELAQNYTVDLNLLNLKRHVRRERRVKAASRARRQALAEIGPRWSETQALLLQRASLAPLIGAVQTRLAAAVQDASEVVVRSINDGILRQYDKLRSDLRTFQDALSEGEPIQELEATLDDSFDAAQIVDDLHKALHAATANVPESIGVLGEAAIQQLATDPFAEVDVVQVALRRQLQFLIDSELIAPIREILEDVPRTSQRATTVAEDAIRLVSFTLTDLGETTAEGPDELREVLLPVVEHGLARVEAELELLRVLPDSLVKGVAAQLQVVVDLMDGYAIMGTAEAFEAHGAGYHGAGRLSGFSRISERVTNELKKVLVTLAYRRSAGVLLARRIGAQQDSKGPVVDRALALVDEHSPGAELLDSLPFYYGQLFLGQSAVHSAFWVGREDELAELERAIGRYERGFFGSLLIVGEPGSGKTALREVAIERFLSGRPVYRISPPVGGSCSRRVFVQALQQELRLNGSLDDLVESLPDGSVIVLQDAELWWERSEDGLAVIETLIDLVERSSERSLFLIEMGLHAFKFIDRLVPLGDQALAVVECGPVDAEALKNIVMMRHSSTGLRFQLQGRAEDELSEWALAQLFSAHFAHSQGNIGAALTGWIAHMNAFSDDELEVRKPRFSDTRALDALKVDSVALLVQLVLHRQITVERLARVTATSPASLASDLLGLRRIGLLAKRKRGVVELDPYARNLVVRALSRRSLLP